MSATKPFNVVYDNRLPPCNAECPSGHDIQGWLAQAAKGEYRGAWEIMMENNPLPSVMGRVCYHTCEGVCNRKTFDQSVNIHAVERFVGDLALDENWTVVPPPAILGKKVLVIGSGPAGLSAAYHLTRLGHAVTIGEGGPRAGGMMAYGIPSYRLPRGVLNAEIARIEQMGVEIRLDTPIFDIPGALRDGGFDACFAAVGAYVAKRAELPKTVADHGSKMSVVDAVTFLRGMEVGGRPEIGQRVAVYGGGSTAIDAARTAVRLGATAVRIIYRRSRDKMPAHRIEVEDALQEGVVLSDLRTIKNLGLSGLILERMVLGDDGWPQPTGETETVATDTLMFALGQDIDAAPFRALEDVRVAKDGSVDVASDFQTGHPGLFCGGDMVSANRTVAVAIGHGKKAARHIDAWLRGEIYDADDKRELAPFERINQTYYPRSTAVSGPYIGVETRRRNFSEVVGGLPPRAVLKEAKRCLSCGNCLHCDDCMNLCPDKAISKSDLGSYIVNQDKCRNCGLCVAQCPCGAIHAIAGAVVPGSHQQSHG